MSPETCLKWLLSQQHKSWPAVEFDLQDEKEMLQAASWLAETIHSAWMYAPSGVCDSHESWAN